MKQSRETLKKYFTKGSLPSEEAFGSLIDSTLNFLDEGFHKTPEDGLKVARINEKDKLISFYKQTEMKSPIWSMSLDDEKKLIFSGRSQSKDNEDVPVLSLALSGEDNKPKGKVGINTHRPKYALDVNGVIRAEGRIGVEEKIDQKTKKKSKEPDVKLGVPADGAWYRITEVLHGCEAFEIMAGVRGKQGSGQYALLHAFAVNTFNSKSSITYHAAHYGSRCNQLELRWVSDEQTGKHGYALEIKTRCSYEKSSRIRYFVTKLWFDPEEKPKDTEEKKMEKPKETEEKNVKIKGMSDDKKMTFMEGITHFFNKLWFGPKNGQV